MDLAQQERSAVAEIAAPDHIELLPSTQTNITSLILNAEMMDKALMFARLMSSGRATVPKHLQGSEGDCLAVTLQAMSWNMSPFAVGQKTHLVNGTLGYEAQLVVAVLQATRTIVGEPHYEHKGEGKDLQTRFGAVMRGNSHITWGEWLEFSKVTTKNSPLWNTNPKQQMGYLQAKNWARLYAPGVILGVYTPDELATMPPREMGQVDVVEPPDASDDLKAQARKAAEGGNVSFRRWFKTISEADRTKLSPMRPELEAIWTKADQARTVTDVAQSPAAAPAPTQAQHTAAPAAPAAQAPAQDQPQVTFEWVLAKMNQAKNEDALNVAADWMGELNDPEERRKLSARYDERLAEINSKA